MHPKNQTRYRSLNRIAADPRVRTVLYQRGLNIPAETWFIGGLQKYIPAAMALFAPYVNSYRRLVRGVAAPINIQWGTDNRTVGLRDSWAKVAGRG